MINLQQVKFVSKLIFHSHYQILMLWDCRLGQPPSKSIVYDELGTRLKNTLSYKMHLQSANCFRTE